jgi:hypothetical protein
MAKPKELHPAEGGQTQDAGDGTPGDGGPSPDSPDIINPEDLGDADQGDSDETPTTGILWLDPDVINWPTIRMTSHHDAESAAALAASMAEAQEEPVGVILLEDGTYEGASGMNRCRVAKEAGVQVLVLVRRGTHLDAIRANIATATNQGKTNPRTEVEAITDAVEQGMTAADLMRTTGMSSGWVEDRLLIAKASPVVLDYLGRMRIAIGHAKLIANLEQHADQEEVMAKQLAHNWTVDALAKHLAPPGERTPASSRKLPPCVYCTKVIEDPTDRVQLNACSACAELVGPGKSTAVLDDGTLMVPIELLRGAFTDLLAARSDHAEHLAELLEGLGALPEWQPDPEEEAPAL